MPRLFLYPFRYRHPLTGKWISARYVAEKHEIAAQHAHGSAPPPEIRDVDAIVAMTGDRVLEATREAIRDCREAGTAAKA